MKTMSKMNARLGAVLAGLALLLSGLAAQAGTITYFHNDLAGSPLVATNQDGHVIWRENYRPYGERLVNSAAASGNAVWFTSRRQDAESGLVYMGARHYDPVAGRFVSVDPVGFDEGNIHSFNRYAYANNNPYRYKDPDGRAAETIFDVISFGISVEMFRRDPSLGNFLGAAVDGLAVAIPFVPGGVGSIRALGKGAEVAAEVAKRAPNWGDPNTLARHFREHGADFGAKSADDYATQASQLLRRSQAENLPTKVDADGVIRVYDPKTNTFGAFNSDGTTKTLFKPTSPTYWDRQQGSAPWVP